MPKYSSEELNAVYHALANATRRKILARLVQGDCTVTELSEPFDMSLAAVSKHIKVLEKAGLVSKQKNATIHLCSINYDPLKSAAALVHHFERFWVHDGEVDDSDEAKSTQEEFAQSASVA